MHFEAAFKNRKKHIVETISEISTAHTISTTKHPLWWPFSLQLHNLAADVPNNNDPTSKEFMACSQGTRLID